MSEKETKEENKEVTPAWAQNLQNSLDSLPDRLSEILKPKDPDPEPDEDPSKPQEIPVPQIPPQENPEPEQVKPETEPETPKKKKFWDWLL